MFRVTKEIYFCYGHRLVNYAGKCRNLHGHNGKAVITVETESLDDLGMVVDFTEIKRVIGAWIDNTLDHRMLLHEADPLIPDLRRQGEPFVEMDANPTAETIARLIYDRAVMHGLPVTEVTLWETENSFATYRPTPGVPTKPVVMREFQPTPVAADTIKTPSLPREQGAGSG